MGQVSSDNGMPESVALLMTRTWIVRGGAGPRLPDVIPSLVQASKVGLLHVQDFEQGGTVLQDVSRRVLL